MGFFPPNNTTIKINDWKNNPKESIRLSLENRKFRKEFPGCYDESIDLNKKATEISQDIKKSIELYFQRSNSGVNLFLSGGLDSRNLLAAISEDLKNKTRAITFNSDITGIELSKAIKVANQIGVKHKYKIVDQNDIVENAYRHLWLNDGLSNHVVSILLKLLENNYDNCKFIDGYAGDTQYGGEFLKICKFIKPDDKQTPQLLLKSMLKLEYAFPKKIFHSIITNEEKNIDKILKNGFQKQCDLMWKTEDTILYIDNLLVQTRTRCYILGGGPRTTENFGSVLTPYYHPEIYEKFIVVPPNLRKNRQLQILTM